MLVDRYEVKINDLKREIEDRICGHKSETESRILENERLQRACFEAYMDRIERVMQYAAEAMRCVVIYLMAYAFCAAVIVSLAVAFQIILVYACCAIAFAAITALTYVSIKDVISVGLSPIGRRTRQ